MERSLTIGLMSGTSLDGADAVLADCAHAVPVILAHAHLPFAPSLRQQFLDLQHESDNELHRAALAANELVEHYAHLVRLVLNRAGLRSELVRALGAHGQTVRHRPELGYSWQINAPARLAEMTGIDVVADFRARDIAAGGHGAPLVPALHARVFGHDSRERAVLNLGGIANWTHLPPRGDSAPVRGWDCGPANVLLDHWSNAHGQGTFDGDGQWAAGGQLIPALLEILASEPWLELEPPKSTGRDLFSERWLNAQLSRLGGSPVARDVQATLAEFTAQSAAQSLARHAPRSEEVIVCGGGALNRDLLARLARALAHALGREVALRTSDELGIASGQVEGLAFAWLAHQFLNGAPGNLPAVTGARGARVLGALYPGVLRTPPRPT